MSRHGQGRVLQFAEGKEVHGLQFGASYARDTEQDSNAQQNCDGITCDYFDLGVNFVESFGAIDVALSGRVGRGFNDAPGSSDPRIYALGGQFA